MSEYATLREVPSTLLCQTKAVSSGKPNRFTEISGGLRGMCSVPRYLCMQRACPCRSRFCFLLGNLFSPQQRNHDIRLDSHENLDMDRLRETLKHESCHVYVFSSRSTRVNEYILKGEPPY